MAAIQNLRVHGPLVIAEGAILVFVCSVMVFLRFYARRISGSSLRLDDCAIAAALVSLSCPNRLVIGMEVTLVAGSRYRSLTVTKDYFSVETSLKGLGYASSEGGAGHGHPDANIVSHVSSIWPITLTATGWLARRAHSSACARLH